MGVVQQGIPAEITVELARLCGATTFVETGTHRGKTTKWAAEHFTSVHTIERAESLYDQYSDELSQIEGVTPHLGDSRTLLPRIMEQVGDQPALLWLDGHWSGGVTAGEGDECPLPDELACLAERPDDLILIDDARFFLCAPPQPHQPSQWPTISEVVFALPEGGKRHFVQIVDDVIFAVPKQEALIQCLVDYAQQRSNSFWDHFSRHQKGGRSFTGRLKSALRID